MTPGLERSAAAAGAHHWTEVRLFELLGAWVPDTGDVEVKLLFDRHSAHHAWRARQWWDRLPVLAGVDRPSLSRPPSAPVRDVYREAATCATVVERLAAAYRVALPRAWNAYREHLRLADPVADGSVLRTLGIVADDIARDWQEGEALLQLRLGGAGAVAEAARTVARLETVAAGGEAPAQEEMSGDDPCAQVTDR